VVGATPQGPPVFALRVFRKKKAAIIENNVFVVGFYDYRVLELLAATRISECLSTKASAACFSTFKAYQLYR
jgi:hypothetical protein